MQQWVRARKERDTETNMVVRRSNQLFLLLLLSAQSWRNPLPFFKRHAYPKTQPFIYLLNFILFYFILRFDENGVCLSQMRARLSGGHFRMINEKLYTCTYAALCFFLFASCTLNSFRALNLDHFLLFNRYCFNALSFVTVFINFCFCIILIANLDKKYWVFSGGRRH